MPETRMMYVVRVGGLTFGEESPAVGDVIDPDEYPGRRYDRMVAAGLVEPQRVTVGDEPVDDDDGGDSDEEEQVSLDEMTRDALISELEDRGLSLDDVEGTGSDGYVTVSDLVEAIENYDTLSDE